MKNITIILLLGLTIFTIIALYEWQRANGELSSPSQPELTDLEKSKMQTVYEDDKKKVMLPYDPDKVMFYLSIAIIMAFGSGIITGYATHKYSKLFKHKT